MLDLVDPTIATARENIDYAARPTNLRGLRIGLIENTKKNAEEVLRKVAEKLRDNHGMTVEVMVHKAQRAPLKDAQIAEFKGKVDFVVSGVGDWGACSSGSLLDAVMLEKAGIPAVPVLTDAFDSTAKEMAELWGVPDFRFVMMPHPLASLTPPDVELCANELVSKVLALLQNGQPSWCE